jgi:osmotically-inducible protein OsmY
LPTINRIWIISELDYEPSIDANHIGFMVGDGVVRLAGYVESLAKNASAILATWRVGGVRAIVEYLEV